MQSYIKNFIDFYYNEKARYLDDHHEIKILRENQLTHFLTDFSTRLSRDPIQLLKALSYPVKRIRGNIHEKVSLLAWLLEKTSLEKIHNTGIFEWLSNLYSEALDKSDDLAVNLMQLTNNKCSLPFIMMGMLDQALYLPYNSNQQPHYIYPFFESLKQIIQANPIIASIINTELLGYLNNINSKKEYKIFFNNLCILLRRDKHPDSFSALQCHEGAIYLINFFNMLYQLSGIKEIKEEIKRHATHFFNLLFISPYNSTINESTKTLEHYLKTSLLDERYISINNVIQLIDHGILRKIDTPQHTPKIKKIIKQFKHVIVAEILNEKFQQASPNGIVSNEKRMQWIKEFKNPSSNIAHFIHYQTNLTFFTRTSMTESARALNDMIKRNEKLEGAESALPRTSPPNADHPYRHFAFAGEEIELVRCPSQNLMLARH